MRASERYLEWQKSGRLGYQNGREYHQTLYDVIQFFDISREEFGKMYGDNIIPDTEWRERCQTGHVAAVSYTHLDVYKRQPWSRGASGF